MSKQKQKAIWCDLDGTLCNVKHRLHIFDEMAEASHWDKVDVFSDLCDRDTPNQWCVDILTAMVLTGHEILYITGRSDKFIKKTTAWLLENIPFHKIQKPNIFMRPDGDHTEDSEFKKRVYLKEIRPNYEIVFCLEDRPSVARMCRQIGLTCLQVDDKEF